MKLFTILTLVLFSTLSFSQSYLIMDNGSIITTNNLGRALDLGHYAFPQKVSLQGGRFYVENNAILTTIDDGGLLFKKYEVIPKNISGLGNNYFVSDSKVYGINSQGVLSISENQIFKNIKNFGGNFFVLMNDDLEMYVVNPEAQIVKINVGELDLGSIVEFGGNYFMTNTGSLYTVSKDGAVTLKDGFRIGVISQKGGNYFVDSSGYFFTVSDEGELSMPPLPLTLDTSSIYKTGSNYFIDMEGLFFLVDRQGNVFEELMPDHDFRLANVISK